MTDDTVNLVCEDCGAGYEKPANYKEYAVPTTAYFFIRALQYCDECRRKRELEMLKRLPEVVEQLVNVLT